jgi:hypothetical protein
MKNLILVLVLTLPTLIFGQTINDYVDFDSLNKNLIKNELINIIIEERQNRGIVSIEKDTIPIYAADYNVLYFETYGDESQIHNEDKPISYDLYCKGYNVKSVCKYPSDRVRFAETFIKERESYCNSKIIPEQIYVSEVSFFYNFNKNNKITYHSLIETILDDFFKNDFNVPNILINDISNEKKYIGISCGKYKEENDNFVFIITYVITKKISNKCY